jgi:hypothetical protein
MSNSKEIKVKERKAKEERIKEDIKAGKITRVFYEKRNKKTAIPNTKIQYGSVEDEISERQSTLEDAAFVYRKMLPAILVKLNRIKDYRRLGSIRHKMTTLMAYGILLFVYQIGSRRQANKELPRDIFFENLNAMFPELETMPHADTLARLLERIDVSEIQECMIELVKDLIRKKKFQNHLVNKGFLIAVDGTQKFYRDYKWDDRCLERNIGKDQEIQQFYVYALDSVIVLSNGTTIPFVTIFLKNEDYIKGETKQDCERKAFERMAKKLREIFRGTPITLVLDGLYACGPVISICRKNAWDFMIVLKEDGMSELWNEALGLMTIDTDNRMKVQWGEREHNYFWANNIEYDYGENKTKTVIVNVVICYEIWQEEHKRSTGEIKINETRYAWISSKSLTEKNVFSRCTKIARYRWKIENNILIEKHQGYEFEHCYSYNWNAMEGFHYLMKLGHLMNVMALNSEILHCKVMKLGIRGFIRNLKLACAGCKLNKSKIREVSQNSNCQWRLVY